MGIKSIYLLFVVVAISLMENANAFPRDKSVVKPESIPEFNAKLPEVKDIPKKASSESDVSKVLPGRLTCPYEEVTEDPNCQVHCLPKGYSYGLCVSGFCTCI